MRRCDPQICPCGRHSLRCTRDTLSFHETPAGELALALRVRRYAQVLDCDPTSTPTVSVQIRRGRVQRDTFQT